MTDRPFRTRLDVRGDLDTVNPVGDRPPGTLVQAYDLSPRAWGPRRGNRAFASPWISPGVSSLYDYLTATGASTTAIGRNYEDQFGNLGTQYTLDLWVQYPSSAYSAGSDLIGIYNFGSVGYLAVNIYGASHTDHEKVEVEIRTCDSASVVDTPVTFAGATRISVGSAQTNKHHIRVVRDGASAYLYLNGVLDGSTGSLVASHGNTKVAGDQALVTLHNGASANDTFRGRIMGAVLRDGAFSSYPIENVMPVNPMGRNVHHYFLGRNYDMGGADHYMDLSRNGVHARIIGSNYSVTASNDNAAPAPCAVQGFTSWTTRTNRNAVSVLCGGLLSTNVVS